MSIVSLANSFINSQEWIFAKTMADIPHWYCLKRNCENLGDWDWFVRFMDEFGVIGEFCGRQYKYLYWGDYRYWIMDPTPELCDLINRCVIPENDRKPENFPSCLRTINEL